MDDKVAFNVAIKPSLIIDFFFKLRNVSRNMEREDETLDYEYTSSEEDDVVVTVDDPRNKFLSKLSTNRQIRDSSRNFMFTVGCSVCRMEIRHFCFGNLTSQKILKKTGGFCCGLSDFKRSSIASTLSVEEMSDIEWDFTIYSNKKIYTCPYCAVKFLHVSHVFANGAKFVDERDVPMEMDYWEICVETKGHDARSCDMGYVFFRMPLILPKCFEPSNELTGLEHRLKHSIITNIEVVENLREPAATNCESFITKDFVEDGVFPHYKWYYDMVKTFVFHKCSDSKSHGNITPKAVSVYFEVSL